MPEPSTRSLSSNEQHGFRSFAAVRLVDPADRLTSALKGGHGNDAGRIKQVSKAMESLFAAPVDGRTRQGRGWPDGTDGSDSSDDKDGGLYQDFIQQAMTQSVTQGGGLGLAKMIENSLTHQNHYTAHSSTKK